MMMVLDFTGALAPNLWGFIALFVMSGLGIVAHSIGRRRRRRRRRRGRRAVFRPTLLPGLRWKPAASG